MNNRFWNIRHGIKRVSLYIINAPFDRKCSRWSTVYKGTPLIPCEIQGSGSDAKLVFWREAPPVMFGKSLFP